jgi:hypothetical protein
MGMMKSALALAALLMWPPVTSPPPIAVANLAILPWKSDAALVCLDFTNTSNSSIQAVRFAFSYTSSSVLGDASTEFTGDRTGSFAPGVAILGPKKHFGLQEYGGVAMANCWSSDEVSNVRSTLKVSVAKVVYADGTSWVNADPTQIADVVNY